jgi:hypothetical protein
VDLFPIHCRAQGVPPCGGVDCDDGGGGWPSSWAHQPQDLIGLSYGVLPCTVEADEDGCRLLFFVHVGGKGVFSPPLLSRLVTFANGKTCGWCGNCGAVGLMEAGGYSVTEQVWLGIYDETTGSK